MANIIFSSRKQIHEWVRTIGALDMKQREAVEEVLIDHLDFGGVSEQELKDSVLKRLRALKAEGTIGSADYAAVQAAIDAMIASA